jgi:Phage P22-like portal protein
MARPTNLEVAQKLLSEVKECYQQSVSADSENRDLAIEDIRFVDEEGAQWDEQTRKNRGSRPCYEFDRTSIAIDQVKGDQRQNAPQIKILPTDSKSDRKLARVYEGLIRAIERNSSARTAYNTGFDFALKGGFGAWRVYPKYVEDSFDQELCIGRIENPFTVHFDPSAKDFLKRDANWAIISERIGRDGFEAEHPDMPMTDLDLSSRDHDWLNDKEIRVAEYFKRVRRKKTLALLDDGRVIDYDTIRVIEEELKNPPPGSGIQPIRVLKKREADSTFIRWWKLCGAGIIEGPIDYEWKYIPIVPIYGRVSNIEGKRKYRGLVRKAKDPQKAYNGARTAEIEAVAMVPRSPYILLPSQIKGYENQWREANAKNPLFLYFNASKDLPNGGKPTREPMPEIPQALIALSAQAADDIKASTGKFGPSLGEPQQGELPGAIRQRNTEGDVSSFEFMDNYAESLKYTGEIMVNMIPTVYDGQRTVRILGMDGKEDFVEINQRMPDGTLVHDVSQGRYDVAVDIGPAYTTQRQEAADYLMRFSSGNEMVQQLASDLIAKNLNFDGADELERRLRIPLIRQGVIPPDKLSEEEQAMLPQGPPPPDPTQQALLGKLQADASRSQAQAQKAQVETAATIADLQMRPAQLQKLMADIIGQQLANMAAAGEIGIDPRSGKPVLMKYLQAQEGGVNELAMPRRRMPVTMDMER